MPPIIRSQRQRARAATAQGLPIPTDVVTPAAEPDPVQPAVRLATVAAPLTNRQRWEADVASRLASTEMLQREMREIRTLLQSVLPNVAVASAGPVASSSGASAVASTRRQREPQSASATVASTSRQGASPHGSATLHSSHSLGWHRRWDLPFSTGVQVPVQTLSALRSTKCAVCEIPVVSDTSADGVAVATLASNAQSHTSVSQPISSAPGLKRIGINRTTKLILQ